MKKTILSSVVALTLSSAVTTANASALATAFIDVSNFQITKASNNAVVNTTTDLMGLQYSSNASVGASLTGNAPLSTGTVQSTDPSVGITLYDHLGAVPASYTQSVYSSHIFSSANGDPAANYSFGDQKEIGTPISGLPGVLGSHLYNESTASVIGNGQAGATSNNGLTANWQFTAGFNDSLKFSFLFAAYAESFVSGSAQSPSSANSSLSQIFKLVDIAHPSVNLLSGPATSLTTNTGVSSPLQNGFPDNGSTLPILLGSAFVANETFTSAVLTAGHTYALTANILTSATVVSAVPEPGMLALLGAGMLAMVGGLRRRQAA